MEPYTTQRGGLGVIINGFRFRKDRKHKKTISWRCAIETCTVRALTDIDLTSIIKISNDHNHEQPSQRQLDLNEARTSIKRKAETQLNEKPSKVICPEASKYSSLDAKDAKRLYDVWNYHRSKSRPPLPSNRTETIRSLQTFEHSFVLKTNPNEEIVVLTTTDNLQFFSNSDHIYADGTFKMCPKYFYQIYTLHAYRNGQYVPCVFSLLPNKQEKTYQSMLQMVMKMCKEEGLDLKPGFIHLDLELAAMNAFQRSFPEAKLTACQFHVAQAWWRKINSLGLSTKYKEKDSKEAKWLKLFFGLPALNHEEVEDCFAFVVMAEKPTTCDPRIDSFADFIFENYIQGDSKFPPCLWATENVIGRTRNTCEGFHRHFQEHFGASHPNIFVFLEGLQTEQTHITLKMRTVSSVKAKRIRLRQEKRKELLDKYKNNEISQLDFITHVSYNMLPVTFIH